MSKAALKARKKYDKKNTRRICIKLNKKTDKDILNFIEVQNSMQGTIKMALRKFIERSDKH